MSGSDLRKQVAAWPKAELHLHLEGSIEPETMVELAARRGQSLSVEEARARYDYLDFYGFLDAFKWVTSYLREPADYALITERLLHALARQNVAYAEVTISAGVMLRRGQDAEANFAAIRHAALRSSSVRTQWIFDAVRQFGAEEAMEVARLAVRLKQEGVIAFGIGGDELFEPAAEFRRVFDFIRGEALHVVAHAGEIGGPGEIRDAVELFGAERIGHGIAAMRDPAVMELLSERRIALEICPTSNLRTGALARQLGKPEARVEDHPLRAFFARGLRVALSTDDPAMFYTDLVNEYMQAARLGLTLQQLAQLAAMSWEAAFLPQNEKSALLAAFWRQVAVGAALRGRPGFEV